MALEGVALLLDPCLVACSHRPSVSACNTRAHNDMPHCVSRCVSLSLCLALADIHLLWTGALSGVCFTAVTQTETVLYSCVSKSEGCCMVRWQSLTRGAELMTMNCYRRRFLSCRLGGAHNGMHVWFTWNVFPNIILVRIVAHPTTKHDLQIH